MLTDSSTDSRIEHTKEIVMAREKYKIKRLIK
jgi:hypothetical protein